MDTSRIIKQFAIDTLRAHNIPATWVKGHVYNSRDVLNLFNITEEQKEEFDNSCKDKINLFIECFTTDRIDFTDWLSSDDVVCNSYGYLTQCTGWKKCHDINELAQYYFKEYYTA